MSVSKRRYVFAWLFLVGPAAVGPAETSDVTLDEALQVFGRSSKAIYSYEVYLRGSRSWPTEGKVEKRYSRQALSAEGKRYHERFDADSGESVGIKVFDGEIQRKFSKRQQSGSVGRIDRGFIENGEDYLTYFRTDRGGPPLVEILRQRSGTRLASELTSDLGVLVIESPPEEGIWLANIGYRIWLDSNHGFLPVRIEKYRDTMDHPFSRAEVGEFREVEPGVWAPIDIKVVWMTPEGEEVFVVNNTVDVERSRWNEPLADDLFVLPFPPGARILDKTRSVAIITGEGDTGKNLDQLVQNARETIPMHDPARTSQVAPSPIPVWRVVLISLNVALAVALLAVVVWRRRRRLASVGR